MENQWRRFDKMRRWPDNFVVVGDAVCSFNPLYAQGMTVSSLDAITLRHELGTQARHALSLSGFAARFQRAVARKQIAPWMMATGEDFRYKETQGRRPFVTRLTHAYIDRVIRASASDQLVYTAFLKVMHMLESPLTLAAPSVFARVMSRGSELHDTVSPPSRPFADIQFTP
jgi:2-polyprenyl-6-methoxyphenol hydroxylase-like FAD-dependent oxidoreductase